MKENGNSPDDLKINRRQFIGLGLAVAGLGDFAQLRSADNSINKKVAEARRMEQSTPSVPMGFASQIENQLKTTTYFEERKSVGVGAMIASAAVLYVDKQMRRYHKKSK
ncbi:hypothetical protein BH09PAT1_BH09PAT1_1780 [soil metagenome]